MQTVEIMAGFKDIKSELRIKYPDILTFNDLVLWFQMNGSVLYVHNYDKHEQQIKLATYRAYTKSVDHIFLGPKNCGRKLIYYANEIANAKNTPLDLELRDLFKMHGTLPSLFKF
jgi:hypothetical protein